jgi:hypothetical protein
MPPAGRLVNFLSARTAHSAFTLLLFIEYESNIDELYVNVVTNCVRQNWSQYNAL